MSATATRSVQKLNQKDADAAPVVEEETFDLATGERVCRGWRPERTKDYPNFTIPAPEHVALGLRPELAEARPGRYVLPAALPGNQFAGDFAARVKAIHQEAKARHGVR